MRSLPRESERIHVWPCSHGFWKLLRPLVLICLLLFWLCIGAKVFHLSELDLISHCLESFNLSFMCLWFACVGDLTEFQNTLMSGLFSGGSRITRLDVAKTTKGSGRCQDIGIETHSTSILSLSGWSLFSDAIHFEPLHFNRLDTLFFQCVSWSSCVRFCLWVFSMKRCLVF